MAPDFFMRHPLGGSGYDHDDERGDYLSEKLHNTLRVRPQRCMLWSRSLTKQDKLEAIFMQENESIKNTYRKTTVDPPE